MSGQIWIQSVCHTHGILERNFIYLLVSSADNLITNNLDPDQARQNVRSDQDPVCLTLSWYS